MALVVGWIRVCRIGGMTVVYQTPWHNIPEDSKELTWGHTFSCLPMFRGVPTHTADHKTFFRVSTQITYHLTSQYKEIQRIFRKYCYRNLSLSVVLTALNIINISVFWLVTLNFVDIHHHLIKNIPLISSWEVHVKLLPIYQIKWRHIA